MFFSYNFIINAEFYLHFVFISFFYLFRLVDKLMPKNKINLKRKNERLVLFIRHTHTHGFSNDIRYALGGWFARELNLNWWKTSRTQQCYKLTYNLSPNAMTSKGRLKPKLDHFFRCDHVEILLSRSHIAASSLVIADTDDNSKKQQQQQQRHCCCCCCCSWSHRRRHRQ